MDRSYLFVPGDRNERFQKAWTSPADQVILDLEDAVALTDKVRAREAIGQWLSAERPVVVRVNAADTEWFAADIELIRHPGVLGLIVPKTEVLDARLVTLAQHERKFIIPLIETAVGIRNLPDICATPGVLRLAFGSLDFQVDLGIPGERDALLFFRSQLVYHSKLAQLQAPIDGVTVDIRDDAVLQEDARYAKHLGFGAKLCIHPNQVAGVNATFAPSAAELDWAARVMAAVEKSAGAAVAVDGKMVDRPIILKAQRIQSAQQATRRF